MIKILKNLIANYTKDKLKIDLLPYQLDIIEKMIDKRFRRISIRASTRAGKSYAVAIGAILFALFYPNSKVGIIAPTKPKTKIIMTYIQQFLANSDLEAAVDLDIMNLSKLERLKREVSKTKITFKTGSYIEVLTADLKGRGFSVMGFGYNLTLIDETAEITEEVYSKIYRMLVDDPDAKILEIGNPWFLNHFYEHSMDSNWEVIHIPWELCVKYGRMSKEDIEDQKRNLTEEEFMVLFEANFPKDIENSLFKFEDLELAKRNIEEPKMKPKLILGIDVARLGNDLTVIHLIKQYNSLFILDRTWTFSKQKLTKTAGDIISILKEYNIDIIRMDSTGLGAGLDDMLTEYLNNSSSSTELESIVFSEKAHDERNVNRKADIFFNLNKMFREKQLIIKDDPDLFMQLRRLQYEITSNGKKKIIDGQEKSPDRADALAIGCYSNSENFIIDFGDSFV